MLIALLCESEMKLSDETIEIILDKVKSLAIYKFSMVLLLVLNFNSDVPSEKYKIILEDENSKFLFTTVAFHEDYAWTFITVFGEADLQNEYRLGV
jgi:hypothetical protein